MLASVPRNHPNQTRRRGAWDTVDDRETPDDIFVPLNHEFGFTLDVAAAHHNAKCKRYYSRGPVPANDNGGSRQLTLFPEVYTGDPDALGYDGLLQPWGRGEVVWCNPPFSNIAPWVAKATFCPATVVMLLPANRTEQPWWQEWIEPYRDDYAILDDDPRVRFLPKRRNFKNRGVAIANRTSKNPPFGVCIVIWDRRIRCAN